VVDSDDDLTALPSNTGVTARRIRSAIHRENPIVQLQIDLDALVELPEHPRAAAPISVAVIGVRHKKWSRGLLARMKKRVRACTEP